MKNEKLRSICGSPESKATQTAANLHNKPMIDPILKKSTHMPVSLQTDASKSVERLFGGLESGSRATNVPISNSCIMDTILPSSPSYRFAHQEFHDATFEGSASGSKLEHDGAVSGNLSSASGTDRQGGENSDLQSYIPLTNEIMIAEKCKKVIRSCSSRCLVAKQTAISNAMKLSLKKLGEQLSEAIRRMKHQPVAAPSDISMVVDEYNILKQRLRQLEESVRQLQARRRPPTRCHLLLSSVS